MPEDKKQLEEMIDRRALAILEQATGRSEEQLKEYFLENIT